MSIAPDGVAPDLYDENGEILGGESVHLGGNSATFTALLIIAGAALTVMITILAVTAVRTRRERLKRVAAGKQRIKAELGKTGSFPPVKSPAKKKKR